MAGHESDGARRGSEKRKDGKSDRKSLKTFSKSGSSSKASSPKPTAGDAAAQDGHELNRVDVVRAIMERNDRDVEATDEDPDLTSKL